MPGFREFVSKSHETHTALDINETIVEKEHGAVK